MGDKSTNLPIFKLFSQSIIRKRRLILLYENERLSELFHLYLEIGGYPVVVTEYLETNSIDKNREKRDWRGTILARASMPLK